MTRNLAIRLSLMPLFAGALLAGCSQPSATKVAEAPANAAVPVAAPTPPFSINETMVMIVDHPGELLWDVEKKGGAPKSDEQWYQLENHAVALAGAATLIQLGGTGASDAAWAASPDWKTSAQALSDAALSARNAAKAKDLPALVKANGQIVTACEGCHTKFKPEIPTGGIFMHRRPGVDKPA